MPFEAPWNDANMPTNTEKQVKDFMIAYGVNAVLESSHCEIKHNRTIKDFIEYLKYVPKLETMPSLGENLRRMIVEFFGSDKEFPFEIVKKIRKIEKQAGEIESDLTEVGVD